MTAVHASRKSLLDLEAFCVAKGQQLEEMLGINAECVVRQHNQSIHALFNQAAIEKELLCLNSVI